MCITCYHSMQCTSSYILHVIYKKDTVGDVYTCTCIISATIKLRYVKINLILHIMLHVGIAKGAVIISHMPLRINLC